MASSYMLDKAMYTATIIARASVLRAKNHILYEHMAGQSNTRVYSYARDCSTVPCMHTSWDSPICVWDVPYTYVAIFIDQFTLKLQAFRGTG